MRMSVELMSPIRDEVFPANGSELLITAVEARMTEKKDGRRGDELFRVVSVRAPNLCPSLITILPLLSMKSDE